MVISFHSKMLYFFTNSFVQSFKKKCLVLDCIETICNNNNIVTGKGEQLTSDGEWLCMGPPGLMLGMITQVKRPKPAGLVSNIVCLTPLHIK